MANAKRVIALILLAIFMISCGSKKKITDSKSSDSTTDNTSEQVEKEVIYKDRIIEKVKPVFSEIEIGSPCGADIEMIPVNFTIGSGGNISHVFSKEGKLYISQKIDSTRNSFESLYKDRWKKDSVTLRKDIIVQQESSREVVRTVYPWWFYIAMVLAIIIVVLKIADKFNLWGYIPKIISLISRK